MSDRTFINALISATLPRIVQLTTSVFERAAREAETLDDLASLFGAPKSTERSAVAPTPEVIRRIWNASLSDVAVTLLWGIGDASPDQCFTCTPPTIEQVIAGIDRAQLACETGVSSDDLSFVLREMGNALQALVDASQFGSQEVMIDRRMVVLRSAQGQTIEPRERRFSGT